MGQADVLLLCGLHLALPGALAGLAAIGRAVLRNGRRSPPVRSLAVGANRHTVAVYDLGTVLIAGITLAILQSESPVRWFARYPASLLVIPVAVLVGLGYPALCARLSGLGWQRLARPKVPAVARLAGCATGEEILWRAAAPAALMAGGAHWTWAFGAAGAFFLLLHVGSAGVRGLPYHAGFTVLLTAVVLTGGLLAAACCHIAHNVLLVAFRTADRRSTVDEPVAVPVASRREW